MTDEQEALAMVREAYGDVQNLSPNFNDDFAIHRLALRAVQERKAFAREVSDKMLDLMAGYGVSKDDVKDFIIAKPDPLVEVLWEAGFAHNKDTADKLRTALAKHNARIVFDD